MLSMPIHESELDGSITGSTLPFKNNNRTGRLIICRVVHVLMASVSIHQGTLEGSAIGENLSIKI